MTALSHQTLIVLAGCPFTGKTVIGDTLREILSIPFLAVDRFRPLIFGKTITYKDDPFFDNYQLKKAYPAMFSATAALLKLGDSVIIEGTFSKKSYQINIGRLIKSCPRVFLKMIALELPDEKADELVKKRVSARIVKGVFFRSRNFRGLLAGKENF